MPFRWRLGYCPSFSSLIHRAAVDIIIAFVSITVQIPGGRQALFLKFPPLFLLAKLNGSMSVS